MHLKIHYIDTEQNLIQLKDSLLTCDIVIDAIFGIGYRNEMADLISKVIGLVNNTKNEIKDKKTYSIISIDVPSGVDATTGLVGGAAVEADITVAFEYPKMGLLKYPASNYAGKITIANIGIPRPNPIEKEHFTSKVEHARPRHSTDLEVTDSKLVANIIPRRKVDYHKGNCGRVLIIAGSSGMMGAAVLAANSALRTGSGLVNLCVPRDIKNHVNSMSLEVVVSDLGSINNLTSKSDAIAIGPGLSMNRSTAKLVADLLVSGIVRVPIVIDADGLNSISDPQILKRSAKDIVITPHPGEFARLTRCTVTDIEKDRMGHARRFAEEYGITVLLKGAYTVIAGKGKKLFINPVGNPAMATAGVGDVLCGIITSLIGQGVNSFDAAVAGAYIHGMAGNIASSIKGEHGLIASDIIENIPFAIKSILQFA